MESVKNKMREQKKIMDRKEFYKEYIERNRKIKSDFYLDRNDTKTGNKKKEDSKSYKKHVNKKDEAMNDNYSGTKYKSRHRHENKHNRHRVRKKELRENGEYCNYNVKKM